MDRGNSIKETRFNPGRTLDEHAHAIKTMDSKKQCARSGPAKVVLVDFNNAGAGRVVGYAITLGRIFFNAFAIGHHNSGLF